MLLAGGCVGCYVIGLTTHHWMEYDIVFFTADYGLFEACIDTTRINGTRVCKDLDDWAEESIKNASDPAKAKE